MKCPKCGKEGLRYTDRKEDMRAIGGGKKKHYHITQRRKRAYLKVNDKGESDTSVRKHNEVECRKCGFRGKA